MTLAELRGRLVDAYEAAGERWRLGGKYLRCERRGYHRFGPLATAAEAGVTRGGLRKARRTLDVPPDALVRVCVDCGAVDLVGDV